jgi:hypothetical protein
MKLVSQVNETTDAVFYHSLRGPQMWARYLPAQLNHLAVVEFKIWMCRKYKKKEEGRIFTCHA